MLQSLGKPKCVIMLGHVISEQPGMEDMAAWLRTFLPADIPVKFVPAEELLLVTRCGIRAPFLASSRPHLLKGGTSQPGDHSWICAWA